MLIVHHEFSVKSSIVDVTYVGRSLHLRSFYSGYGNGMRVLIYSLDEHIFDRYTAKPVADPSFLAM